jgi:hypothetical protein
MIELFVGGLFLGAFLVWLASVVLYVRDQREAEREFASQVGHAYWEFVSARLMSPTTASDFEVRWGQNRG